ncbi:hypothetical protein D9M68_593270 [compost metagenome]
MADVITLWQRARISGRHDEVASAFACIGSGQTKVLHPPLVVIIDQANVRAGRQLNHHRSLRKVDYS